jgi:hypothetical protein
MYSLSDDTIFLTEDLAGARRGGDEEQLNRSAPGEGLESSLIERGGRAIISTTPSLARLIAVFLNWAVPSPQLGVPRRKRSRASLCPASLMILVRSVAAWTPTLVVITLMKAFSYCRHFRRSISLPRLEAFRGGP